VFFSSRVFCAADAFGISLAPNVALENATHFSKLGILAALTPQTRTRDGMTRIGFAYNQKPELSVGGRTGTAAIEQRPDEEPPSTADVYAEWDSAETIDAVASALSAFGDVIRIEADESLPERLRAERPDIVFNIAEGLHGTNREAHVPAICEFFAIPYSGSDPFTLSLCLDKARTKDFLTAHGIPNARYAVIEDQASLARLLAGEMGSDSIFSKFPVFLKPVHEGSSKGITEKNFVRDRDELETQARFLLATYDQPVIAEEFLPGAEFTCGVLGNGASAQVLPIVGMNFESLPEGALPIYGYEAKWVWDTPDEPLDIFECPARVSPALQRSIEDVVLRAYRILGCRDWSRIDVRLDATGKPNIVEVNPLPGILPNPEDNSCLPKAARAAGLNYDELIQSALRHAAERTGVTLRAQRRRAARRPSPVALPA
jgi:D-alanine-D-alanine ligase